MRYLPTMYAIPREVVASTAYNFVRGTTSSSPWAVKRSLLVSVRLGVVSNPSTTNTASNLNLLSMTPPIKIEAAAQKLLNPSDEFDVSLLDDVVAAAYSPTDPDRALANKALMALQETPDVWTKADAILERAQNPQSRFFGLQVLDDAIRTR